MDHQHKLRQYQILN